MQEGSEGQLRTTSWSHSAVSLSNRTRRIGPLPPCAESAALPGWAVPRPAHVLGVNRVTVRLRAVFR